MLVTGRVGDVLRESAMLAYSFWRSRGGRFGLNADRLAGWDLHVHFPRASRPKEGSSAGLPIALALASLLADESLPARTAALGEITLHGRLLPVDRLPERLAAAERAGLAHVILPERSRADVEGARDLELPQSLALTYVETVTEAVATVLPALAGREARTG
jgi:ATP-dependent Lon protease